MSDKFIHILMQKDAKGIPFAKVLYNGQDAFELDDETKVFATYVARKAAVSKAVDKVVFISTIDNTVLDADYIDRLYDMDYCISGCESGKKAVENLIRTVCCGASNLSVATPVYATDGISEPIFVNEESISSSYQAIDLATRDELECDKLARLSGMIEKPTQYVKKEL